MAQDVAAARRYDIAAGPLDRVLPIFARESGLQLLYPTALVAGRRSPGLSGEHGPETALAALLDGSGLAWRRSRPNVFVVYDPSAQAEALSPATELDEVVVTGSLLRGVIDGPSPVTVISRDQIDRDGHATVAQALAALPQNFGGTANEGALQNGADRTGSNGGFASGVNLRGLGSDATLVLVNGRRMSGTGSFGDFADISTIPTNAISRIDVLLDGASALYGHDLAEDIFANCGVEVVFAPKNLKTAQNLSERLGAYTYAARSRSLPRGLGGGRRTVTVSDQRRPLMLPQELLQMLPTELLVLKAGLPAIRGRKIAYYREPVLRRRLRPAPQIDPAPPRGKSATGSTA
ncbi:MAG: TonB-dependent receptor plug domain-containing protein [Brevundimonas diminuta]|nr:TonB-dependent receptor plug domain-containing protein [Brevundimonas diminuta]MBD3817800.1 TonB-dependent receptor plug domain-containing protein [Brevundimonas diminuta]